jgi:hypothetical protein
LASCCLKYFWIILLIQKPQELQRIWLLRINCSLVQCFFSNILRISDLQLKMTAESHLIYQENCHFMNILPSVLELFYVRGRSNEYNAVCFGKELHIFKHRFFILVLVGILKSRVSTPPSLYGGSLAIPLNNEFLVYFTFYHIYLHRVKENLK